MASAPVATEALEAGVEAGAPVVMAAMPNDGIATQAANVTVGGLTIAGGIQNTDFTVSGTTVVVQTSTPLTLSGTLTNGTIQIKQGTSANITLNGVTITNNTTSSPINLIGTGTTLRLTLADGTTNSIAVSSVSSVFCAGIHCGAGSTLYVDDSVANWSGSAHVDVLNGVVDTAATLDNGTTVVKGDPVTRLASSNPGTLVVKGGGGSAAIGSGPAENAGNMHFDGGNITAYSAGGHASNGGTNANQNWSSGTGIGSGSMGGCTNMWFDGANVDAFGSYHGAGVGAGWSSGPSAQQTGAVAGAGNMSCGNIYINAGYLKAQGYEHGNAFGGACGTNANNRIIRITGGTLHPTSNSSRKDIGGDGGYTIVTGGSVYVANKDKFTGIGGTAFNTQNVTTWSDVTALGGKLPDADKVFMLTVDLSQSSEKMTDEKLEKFDLYIGGKKANYGAPTQFEGGKLYLWLPEWVAAKNAEKEVRIEMSVRTKDGVREIDPLFIAKPSTSNTTQTVKRYIEFAFPKEYEETLHKFYDGTPFAPFTVSADNPIDIVRTVGGKTINETLNDNDQVKFKYQMLAPDGKGDWVAAGSESTEGAGAQAMPADAGRFQVTMTSYQYAKLADYQASYWGHQAKGTAVIRPVTSKVGVAVPEEHAVKLSYEADGGTVTKSYTVPTWAQDDNAGNYNTATNNHLVVPVDVTSDLLPFNESQGGSTMSSTGCKAPTGTLQLYIDGHAVPARLGGVIQVDAKDLEDGDTANGEKYADGSGREHTVAHFNLTRSKIESFFKLYRTDDDEHTVYVTYTSARANAVPRDSVASQADESGIATQAEEEAATPDAGSQAGVGDVVPAYDDSSYVNYYESTTPASEVVIELAEPDFKLYNEDGTKYEPNEKGEPATADKPVLDQDHERDWMSDTGRPQGKEDDVEVKNFRDVVDDNGNVTETQQDWFPLHVVTNSIGDIEFKSSNPSVIRIEPGTVANRDYVEDKTDYGVGAKAHVVSAGKTTITATIKGTGAYSGATKSFDVYVYPDRAAKPVLDIQQTSYNTSRDDGTIRPGDTLRNVVEVTNTTKDSDCVNPVVTVTVPENTTFKRLVVVDPEGNETDITDQVKDKIKDGVITVDTVPHIFGSETYRFKLDSEVDPEIITVEKPNLESKSTAEGVYGTEQAFEWDKRIPEGGEPVDKVEATADPTGPAPKDPTGGDKPGTPGDEPGGDNPGGDNPGGDQPGGDQPGGDNPGGNEDPDNPDNPGGDKPANPDDPTGPADPDDRDDHDLIVVPTDPDPKAGDITVAKSWTNVTAGADKRTNKEIVQVGDELSYTITVANTKPGAAYYGTTVADELPVGMEYVPGSIEIAHVGLFGTDTYKKDDFKADYNAQSRKLYIAVGHLLGGEQATVTFRVRVTTERLNYNDPQSLVNVGRAFGTDPSDTVTDPEPDPNHPDDTPEGPKGRDIPDGTPGPYGDENPPTDPIDDERGKEEPTTQEISYTVKTEKKEAEGGDADALTAIQLLEKLRALVAADGYDLAGEPATATLTDGDGKAIEKVSLVETGKGVYTATFKKDDGSTVKATLTHVVWDEDSSDEDRKDEVSEYKASASVSEKVGEGAMTQGELVQRALSMAKNRDLVIPADMEHGQWRVYRVDADGKEEELGADEVVDRSQEGTYVVRADYAREATDEHGAMAGPLTLIYSLFDTSQPQSEPGPGTSGPIAPANPDPSKVQVTKDSTNTTPHDDGKVHVGDVLAYEISVANNDAPSTCLYDLVVSDELPAGIEVVSGSLVMELPGGATKEVPDSVYNPLTHSLSVYGGYLKGGEAIKLRFKAKVAESAEGTDIGNRAVASYVDPSDSSTGTIFGTEPRPKPGEPAKSGDFKGSKLLEPTRAAYPDGVTDPVAPAVSGTGLPDTGTLRPVPVSGLLRGLLPVTGDTGPVTGLVAAVAAALGATAWVLRRRRGGEEDAS